jgi:hypothetical protein
MDLLLPFPMVTADNLMINNIVSHNRHPKIINHVEDWTSLNQASVLTLTDADGTVEVVFLAPGETIKHLDTWTYADWASYVLL